MDIKHSRALEILVNFPNEEESHSATILLIIKLSTKLKTSNSEDYLQSQGFHGGYQLTGQNRQHMTESDQEKGYVTTL